MHKSRRELTNSRGFRQIVHIFSKRATFPTAVYLERQQITPMFGGLNIEKTELPPNIMLSAVFLKKQLKEKWLFMQKIVLFHQTM